MKRPPTELEKKRRQRFREATLFAKTMDARLREHYERKAKELGLPSAYNAAVKEYLLTHG